jgi:signal peptidase I
VWPDEDEAETPAPKARRKFGRARLDVPEPPPARRPVPTPAAVRARERSASVAVPEAKPVEEPAVKPLSVASREAEEQDKKHGWVRLVAVLVVAAAIALVLRAFVISPYYIPSGSMETTLHGCGGCNNDHVLVDKLSYKLHDVHRGDVVVFHRPARWAVPEKLLIKRVIGLPGDVITDHGGAVYINGLMLIEPYVKSGCTTDLGKAQFTVPAGQYFVMGDNRCPGQSADSRLFGTITKSAIVGRAFVIIWPLGRLHWI